MTRAEAKGFTVIELLIVLGILAIIAFSLAPGLSEALRTPVRPPSRPGLPDDAARQQATVAEIRYTGTAMFSWLTDQVGAAAAGQIGTSVDFRDYPAIAPEDLQTLLVPIYLNVLPKGDGWNNPYDYALNASNPLAEHVMAIRSLGRDLTPEGDIYTVTSFDPASFENDIVWTDGFFVRWPGKG